MQDPPSPHGFEKNGNLGFKMNDLSKIKDFIHNMWIWSFPKNEYPKSSKVTSWPVDQFSIETHGFFGDLVRNPYVCICQCIEYRAQCIRYGELNTSIGSTTLCNTIYIYLYISPNITEAVRLRLYRDSTVSIAMSKAREIPILGLKTKAMQLHLPVRLWK